MDQWKGTKIISTFVAVGMGTPEGQTFNKTIYNEQFWILNISTDVRYIYSSWASPSGMILLGGLFSRRTTEKIGEDGTSTYSFELKYNTS